MPNYIPVITPVDAQLLVRYFSGIDKILAHRFTLGFSPDEEHLTSLLCELLDDRGSELHQLPYTAQQLRQDLKQNNSLLNVSFSLETTQFNKFQERNITQSDVGIIVNYTDTIKRDNSFRKGILIQAKKLFTDKNNIYSIESQYKSFDMDQHNRLHSLVEYISKLRDSDNGDGCAAYLFYNPPLGSLPERDKEVILYEQIRGLHYIYEEGMFLYRRYGYFPYIPPESSDTSFFMEASSIIMPFYDMDRMIEHATANKSAKSVDLSLRLVLEHTRMHYNAFAHFIVFSLLLGSSGCQNPEWLKVVSGIRPSVTADTGLFRPRYVFTINISAGNAPG